MKNYPTSFLVFFLSFSLLFSSCISLKKYNETGRNYQKCKDEKANLEKQFKTLNDKYTELESVSKKMLVEMRQLISDTASLRKELMYKIAEMKEVSNQLDALQVSTGNSAKGTEKELRLLLQDFQKNKDILLQKEDSLKKMDKELKERELNLKKLTVKFKQKEARVIELERILNAKDSVVNALKKSVSDALLGYFNKGLSVSLKNGKVYVSMDETLLFASGSWQVGTQGIEAIKKLIRVLKENPDINIMVEGHTDNVPYKGAGQVKDNWDLSVMRATAVAKIILENSEIQPFRVTAAGKGEYLPLDHSNSKEARAKNRRTEIILTPKLDELLKIIESN
ncbi:MAG: OmpA family protein [Bacteroidetes bacterium]|nr:OmpA family protein [Bacteroidota bacterium]